MNGGSFTIYFDDDVLNDGSMIGQEIDLTCGGVFKGTGYVESPQITITTEQFEYTGTIKSDGVCTIMTREPFDVGMFKREGTGEFIVGRYIEVGGTKFTFKGESQLVILSFIEENNLEMVREILDKNPEMENEKDLTKCMLAAGSCNNLEMVQELIQLGANVTGKKSCREYPITFAVAEKNTEWLKVLLYCGANPNSKNNRGVPVLISAICNNDIDTVRTLLDLENINADISNGKGETAFRVAANKGYSEMVDLLLEKGPRLFRAGDPSSLVNTPEEAVWLVRKDKFWMAAKKVAVFSGVALAVGAGMYLCYLLDIE